MRRRELSRGRMLVGDFERVRDGGGDVKRERGWMAGVMWRGGFKKRRKH